MKAFAEKTVFFLSESQKVGKGESFFSMIVEKNRNLLPLFRFLNKVSNLLAGNWQIKKTQQKRERAREREREHY